MCVGSWDQWHKELLDTEPTTSRPLRQRTSSLVTHGGLLNFLLTLDLRRIISWCSVSFCLRSIFFFESSKLYGDKRHVGIFFFCNTHSWGWEWNIQPTSLTFDELWIRLWNVCHHSQIPLPCLTPLDDSNIFFSWAYQFSVGILRDLTPLTANSRVLKSAIF